MNNISPEKEAQFLPNYTTEADTLCLETDHFGSSTHFEIQMIWVVSWLMILEYGVLWYQEKPLPAYHENLSSLCHAIFNAMIKISVRTFEFSCYIWLWKNYSIWPCLFPKSALSFATVVIAIDFGFYWFHRASHEIMLFWAIHQVHHSSADYSIMIGLRHSPLQNIFSWIFYLPLAAIGLPPSHLLFHLQLNLLLQTWIHTCTVSQMGVLEWVLNTPSHHRVHHGITLHCLDKNFGGIFIIWDLIFGTFEREDPQQENLYGIIYQPEFWNIFSHQVFYIQRAFEKAKTMTNWKNYFETFIKGPSWYPGLSWTGAEGHKPDFNDQLRRDRIKANSSIAINCYVSAHLLATLIAFTSVAESENAGLLMNAAHNFHILITLANIGFIYEGRSMVIIIELFRCLIGLALTATLPLTSWIIWVFLLLMYSVSLVIMAYSAAIKDNKRPKTA